MTPPFNESANLRAEIIHDLISLGVERHEAAIEPEDATRQAHELMLRYLREVLDRPEVAAAFAAAVGLIETSPPMDE